MIRTVTGSSIQEAWTTLLRELYYSYEYTPAPRGHNTREITGLSLRIRDMRNNIIVHPERNINYKFMVAEWLWMAMGMNDLETLTKYNGQMSRFSDDGKILAGAYGPMLATQWDYVMDSLRKDSVSRQAVATIWRPNPSPSKDIPCTISMQFITRNGWLHLIVTMRSSDVWLGIPYDVYSFSQLANGIAGELGLKPGYLQMQLGSSHLYENDFEKAERILNSNPFAHHGLRSPALPGRPPSFMAEIVKNPKSGSNVESPTWQKYGAVLDSLNWTQARNILESM